ncbi:hypothetical protein NC652_023397 [Populus alba x Populus x berolinensis]|nr:hypothetical protein NC652_023397 [Populus alba x Populus x berolinensis]
MIFNGTDLRYVDDDVSEVARPVMVTLRSAKRDTVDPLKASQSRYPFTILLLHLVAELLLSLIKVHSSLLSARHGTPTGESGLSESRVFRKLKHS